MVHLVSVLLTTVAAAAASSTFHASPPQAFSYRDVGFSGGGWVTGLILHAPSGIVYARTDVGGAYRSDDGGRRWQWLSGNMASADPSWSTQGLAVNASEPSGLTVLFALGGGPPSPASGIYKSLDGGVTWVRKLGGVAANSNGFTRHASPMLTVDAGRPWRVWAAMQQGLFLSGDGGETWGPVASFNSQPFYNGSSPELHGGYAMALVSLVPPDPTSGVVDPALAHHVVVGANIMGLAFSPDDGATWQQLSVAAGTLPVNISTPWRFHRMPNGSAIVGADFAEGGHAGTTGGVFRVTAPSAAAWADPRLWRWEDITPSGPAWGFWGLVDTPRGFDGGLLVIAASDPDTIFTSSDFGTSWRRRNASVTASPPCWQPAPTQTQLLPFGRNNIVISSRDASASWLLSTGFGVARSTDDGDSWSWASEGIGEVVTFRCHSHPRVANWTFCGVADLTGFILTDGGVSGRGLAVYAHEPTFWATDFAHGVAWGSLGNATGAAVGLSFPGGYQLGGSLGQWVEWPAPADAPSSVLSWKPGVNTSGVLHGVPLQFGAVLQSADDALDLLLLSSASDYSGTFRPWSATQPLAEYTGGVVRSRDGGASWQHVAQQPPAGVVGAVYSDFCQLALDGGDADARWWALQGAGLFLSRDRGENWGTPLPTLCAGADFNAGVTPDANTTTGGAGAVYVLGAGSCFGADAALRHTADYGRTWKTIGAFTAPYSAPLAAHASGRIAIVAVAAGDALPHVWVSADSGASWQPVDLVERSHYLAPGVSGLEFDAVDPSVLYISLAGHSVVVVKFE